MEESNNKCPEFVQEILQKMNLDPKDLTKEKEIKTDSSSDEDETLDLQIKAISPSKYFGKRVSFDYHNLKKIEKPILRRTSLLEKIQEKKELALFAKKEDKILVKFDEKIEEIKNEEPKNSDSHENQQKKPQKKSILKNTCFSEQLDITKIFTDRKFYQEIIEKIEKECGDNQELLKEKLTGFYNEFLVKTLNENRKENIVNLLQVRNFY